MSAFHIQILSWPIQTSAGTFGATVSGVSPSKWAGGRSNFPRNSGTVSRGFGSPSACSSYPWCRFISFGKLPSSYLSQHICRVISHNPSPAGITAMPGTGSADPMRKWKWWAGSFGRPQPRSCSWWRWDGRWGGTQPSARALSASRDDGGRGGGVDEGRSHQWERGWSAERDDEGFEQGDSNAKKSWWKHQNQRAKEAPQIPWPWPSCTAEGPAGQEAFFEVKEKKHGSEAEGKMDQKKGLADPKAEQAPGKKDRKKGLADPKAKVAPGKKDRKKRLADPKAKVAPGKKDRKKRLADPKAKVAPGKKDQKKRRADPKAKVAPQDQKEAVPEDKDEADEKKVFLKKLHSATWLWGRRCLWRSFIHGLKLRDLKLAASFTA